MGDEYLKALACQPPRILGLRMLPFSVGHAYLLRKLASPLAVGGEPLHADLLIAVWLCAHKWRDNVRHLFGGEPFNAEARWARRINRRGWDYARVRAEVQQYVDDYSDAPQRWTPVNGSAKGYAAPWEMHLVRTLCAVYGVRLDEAWDVPLAQAIAWHFVDGEANGDDSLVSEHQKELIARANGAQP